MGVRGILLHLLRLSIDRIDRNTENMGQNRFQRKQCGRVCQQTVVCIIKITDCRCHFNAVLYDYDFFFPFSGDVRYVDLWKRLRQGWV